MSADTVNVPREAVQRLILAADCYGVRFLDSDDMSDEAVELQDATEAMKDRLAASTPVGGWEDISTAPDLERVMVCGWNPPHKRVAGYWWWYEDTTHEGRAVEHPTALYWSPINLPVFPPPPSVSTGSRPQEAVPTGQAEPAVVVPRDQLETLRRSLELGNLVPGEGETLINCWIFASEAESKA